MEIDLKYIVIETLNNSVIGHQVFEDKEDAIRNAVERGMENTQFSKAEIEQELRKAEKFTYLDWEVCYRQL